MTLLVIRGANCDLIPCLLQSSHVFPIRPGLHARRRRVHLKGVRDKFKALVQQCANLGIACSDQCKISLFFGFCHMGLLKGSVANFVQEVLKGQLPLSERGLSGQGVELFGRGEALLNSVCKLPFAQHVHQFDAGEGGLRCVECFEP
jgi:hypothetical protein